MAHEFEILTADLIEGAALPLDLKVTDSESGHTVMEGWHGMSLRDIPLLALEAVHDLTLRPALATAAAAAAGTATPPQSWSSSLLTEDDDDDF